MCRKGGAVPRCLQIADLTRCIHRQAVFEHDITLRYLLHKSLEATLLCLLLVLKHGGAAGPKEHALAASWTKHSALHPKPKPQTVWVTPFGLCLA